MAGCSDGAGGDLLMGPESRMLLQQVLQSSDAHVRIRGLHLLMSAAAQTPGNIQALRSSGASLHQLLCKGTDVTMDSRRPSLNDGAVSITVAAAASQAQYVSSHAEPRGPDCRLGACHHAFFLRSCLMH